MKKITIILISVLMIFVSCSMDTSYDDGSETKEKTSTEIIEDEPSNEENNSEIEEPKKDDTENEEPNTEIIEDEPSNEENEVEEPSSNPIKNEDNNTENESSESNNEIEEPKEDNTENKTEEPSDTNIEIIEDEPSNEENKSENNDVITEPTENNSNDDEKNNSENNETIENEPSNEEVVENKTWCDISEDTLILGLNYFVCIDNSQTKLKPSINVESKAKTGTFLVRGYASRYVEIRVRYDNEKLNFSSVNDSYTITNVTIEDSTINIFIEWK